MIVEVVGGAAEAPEVRVVDVHDLKRLHLAAGALADADVDGALRTAGLGRLKDGDTAFLDIAAFRAAAAGQATAADWGEQFEGMVGYARSKGWLSDDGASLQVHVERVAGDLL